MTRRDDDDVDDIAARTAARAAALLERIEGMRRLAAPADYLYDKAQDKYWDIRDGTLHVANAVDNSIPIELWRVVVDEPPPVPEGTPRGPGRPRRPRERLVKPSIDIARVETDQFVEGATWWPGQPQILIDWFVDESGPRQAIGRRAYNTYREAPEAPGGDPARAKFWVDHVKHLWARPEEHEYFFDYCAHMLQRPEEKCNAAIILSGTQGIGKDAALLPMRLAMGAWNVRAIEPDQLFANFKPWIQTLLLIVDEVRPSKDEFTASSMYNILKPLISAPPDTLPLEEKFARLRYVVNVMRVVITTNDWMSMYIPAEDRRMFIMHSTLAQKWHEAAGDPEYFRRFFRQIEGGGWRDIAAWLRARDLSNFDPKAQVARTAGWQAVAQTWGEPDDAVAAAIDALGKPDVLFGIELVNALFDDAEEVRGMLKSPRKIGHRMQRAGYLAVPPPGGEQTWRHGKWKSKLAFARADLANEKALEVVKLLKARAAKLAAEKAGKEPM